jgi:hypothetical protein
MANNLYSGILDDEDQGDKKTIAARSLACYAIININLSDSCMDVVRRLKTKDPRACWEALAAEYDQVNPTTTMMMLDALLDLKCTGPLQLYISEFNVLVARLQSMGVTFDEALLIALLLRGLPPAYEMFCSTVRHREKMPRLDQLFAMLKLEEKLVLRKGGSSPYVPSSYVAAQDVAGTPNNRCDVPGCSKVGHTRERCWVLHPDLAPVCKKCDQRGHFTKFCKNERQQEGASNAYAEMPPISL